MKIGEDGEVEELTIKHLCNRFLNAKLRKRKSSEIGTTSVATRFNHSESLSN